MTKKEKFYSKSAFSEWIRNYGPDSSPGRDGVDVQDIDFVVFAYMTGDLMTLETKERGGYIKDKAQRDTQNIVRQLLYLGTSNNSTVNTLRGVRHIRYHGHHFVQFQNSTPDDGWVKVDGCVLSREQFLLFLNFNRPLYSMKLSQIHVVRLKQTASWTAER